MEKHPKTYSLMDLPVEIRLMIYQYLIPNSRSGKSLREDGEQCATALLQANSTIYGELVQEWYGSIPYDLSVDIDGTVEFAFQKYRLGGPLPSNLLQVSSLCLYISLLRSPHHESPRGLSNSAKERAYTYRAGIKAIAELFARPECRLRHIHLVAFFTEPGYVTFRGDPDNLRRALHWIFDPLRERVRVSSMTFGHWIPRVIGLPRRIDEDRELVEIITDFLEESKREMVA